MTTTTPDVFFKHRRTEAGYEVIMPNGVPWLVVALKCPRPWLQSPSNVTLEALNAWASDIGLQGYFEQSVPGDVTSYGYRSFNGEFYGAELCRGNLDAFFKLIDYTPAVDVITPPNYTEEVSKLLGLVESPNFGALVEMALAEAFCSGYKAAKV